jgi:predicted alpha-1,2-mannosidase
LITPNSDFDKGYIRINHLKGEIYGYNPVHRIYQGWGEEAGFDGHFIVQVNRITAARGTFSEERVFLKDEISKQKSMGAFLGFKIKAGETILVRIGSSFTSEDGARKNLSAEISDWDYNKVKHANKRVWETSLAKIKVTTASKRDKRIFYTSFYHALQHPRLYNDVDGTYPSFSSQHQLSRLKQGNYYDDFSLWDTYRAQLPLLEIIEPKIINDFARSLVLKGQQGGFLPIFPCWNSYTSEMIGDHCCSVLASAYLKGIRDFDYDEAYRLMRQNAFDQPKTKQEYIQGKGRRALESYLQYGYIPLEDAVIDAFHKREQVSRVMEYAYDDYALGQMAGALGKKGDYDTLMKRALNYKNVFDPRVGLVRGRYADGSWFSPFQPDQKETYITEGTPRQYTFYVPHDIAGLSSLMGGGKGLENALDTLFSQNEYWHGNEPGHQVPFMYNYTASPWKSQHAVSQILKSEYGDGPGGLSGNDDAGQMSAWYMFASMGFYPLNPVSGEYLLTAPIFDKIILDLKPRGKITIITHRKQKNDIYISHIKLNGKIYPYNYIRYADLNQDTKLEFYLQATPEKSWGNLSDHQPSSIYQKKDLE